MVYRDIVENLAPDVVERLRRAIETGRWPDGRPVTPGQREHSLQAVIAWEAKHLPPEERVGHIDKGRKGTRPSEDEPRPLRWRTGTGSDEA